MQFQLNGDPALWRLRHIAPVINPAYCRLGDLTGARLGLTFLDVASQANFILSTVRAAIRAAGEYQLYLTAAYHGN